MDEITALLVRWEVAAAHRVRAGAARAVLSVPEYLALAELVHRPARLSGATVADIVGVGSGGISGILTRLEEQELAEREPDPEDARGMLWSATDAGRDLLRDRTERLPGHTLADLLHGATTDQLRLLTSFLSLVVDRVYGETRHVRGLDRKR